MDDMNFLLHREQEELLRAGHSRNRDKRDRHLAVAKSYARRIVEHRLPYRSKPTGSRGIFDPASYGGDA